MKRMLQLGPAILEEGVKDVENKNKFMGNLVDRGIFGKDKCDFGRKDLCEGQNKEEVEVTVAVEPPKKPKISEDEINDKGSHPPRKVQFFLTLFKRPLTP